ADELASIQQDVHCLEINIDFSSAGQLKCIFEEDCQSYMDRLTPLALCLSFSHKQLQNCIMFPLAAKIHQEFVSQSVLDHEFFITML
ncbi:hypothetical protein PGIGA_G00205930, partial [Pangasianodon gigas]|nr:hypothetical protein [Pangasianodon gigas]